VTSGEIFFKGQNILELEPDERARMGLFLAFQYPVAIPGVTVANFLRTAINARRRAANPEDKGVPIPEFRKTLKQKMEALKVDHNFAGRYLNDGFSGGEKKRAEILQMAVLKPEIAILDETDSGLDIDALRIVSEGVNALRGSDLGVLLITHYQRMLNYITPDWVHIMLDGRIVESGKAELALHLEEQGYDWVREKYEPANF
jgi:Fe-S cluster assembly ATP-binding protein